MVYVVKSADTSEGRRFSDRVDSLLRDTNPQRVAFDCEGVRLSRVGSLELVSICFPDMEVYLLDFGSHPCPDIVRSTKELFENDEVTKIIHDCRVDCDALFHLHGIKLVNVHDTSCFHDVIAHTEHKSLNAVLMHNGIRPNTKRDNAVYKHDPRFWSRRPLSKRMLDWASSDVDKLFALADAQLLAAPTASKRAVASAKSTRYTRTVRDMNVVTDLRVRNPGLFVGSGGQNIRNLTARTGTQVYQDEAKGTWIVFYPSTASLNAVKRQMEL